MWWENECRPVCGGSEPSPGEAKPRQAGAQGNSLLGGSRKSPGSTPSPSTCLFHFLRAKEEAGRNESTSVTSSQRNLLRQKAVEARRGSSPFSRGQERGSEKPATVMTNRVLSP